MLNLTILRLTNLLFDCLYLFIYFLGEGGGGGDLCGLLMDHCQWTLIIYMNLRLAPKLPGIDPGFFRYICGHTEIFNLANLSRIRQ